MVRGCRIFETIEFGLQRLFAEDEPGVGLIHPAVRYDPVVKHLRVVLRTLQDRRQLRVLSNSDDDRFVRHRWFKPQMYCLRINLRSRSDKSLLTEVEKPSVVQDAGMGYIMMDFGSSGVASTSSGDAGVSTLNSICSTDQLLGGPERSRITASRFQ